MVYWPHNGNIEVPPELGDLRWRRPKMKHYWESGAGDKETALAGFWLKWKRETGKEYPRKPPFAPSRERIRVTLNRIQKSRRPDHHQEKNSQDI